jgi:hypothetical protein
MVQAKGEPERDRLRPGHDRQGRQACEAGRLKGQTMRPKADPVSEIASLFLEKDEVGQMMLDNLFSTVDLQIDLAQARIARGERSAVVFAAMRDAMRRLRRASY